MGRRRTQEQPETSRRRYGSAGDVQSIFGISKRTLYTDRQLGRNRFPSYQAGRRVLYDLDEVEDIIRRNRRGCDNATEVAGQ